MEPEKLFRNVVRHIVNTNSKQEIAMRIERYEAKHGKCKADDLRFFIDLETMRVQQDWVQHKVGGVGRGNIHATVNTDKQGSHRKSLAAV